MASVRFSGHVVDGAGVQRDVLAGAAVTAGGGTHQSAVAVDQRQRDAVDLELAQVMRVFADLAADARRPGGEFLGRKHVVQAQHPLEVLGRGEVGREPGAADQLGRRIGCPQLGVLLLQRRQFAQQFVEFGIGNDRRIPHVVAELVLAHLVGKFLPAAAQVGSRGFVGLLRQRRLRIGDLRAHPRRLAEAADTPPLTLCR